MSTNPYQWSPSPPLPQQPAPPLAGWGTRAAAMLVDAAVLGVPFTAALVFAMATATPQTDPYDAGSPTTAGGLALFLGFLWLFGGWIWNRIVRQGRSGRSLGKSALGIRLLDGQRLAPVGAGSAFLRDIAHHLDAVAFLGFVWPLWDARRQTFADKICGTVVVRG